MKFICPKCMKNLRALGGAAVCESGHSYDRSRAGYYNLLLSNKSTTHGDNRERVEARRAFLSLGYYSPLAECVADILVARTPAVPLVLDAGSGEGYYTDIVERALYERDSMSAVHAFDISKDAVQKVAKRNPRITLAVAGSYKMPLANSSVDAVMNTFSPLAREETHRVLKSGGIFVLAIPGEDHLFELKAAIYDDPYKNTVADTALEGFSLIDTRTLKYTMNLSSGDEVRALFGMTPYAYRTPPHCRARVTSLDSLDVTAHFHVFVYEKC